MRIESPRAAPLGPLGRPEPRLSEKSGSLGRFLPKHAVPFGL